MTIVKNVQGLKYNQNNLELGLANVAAGQSRLMKLVAVCVVTLLGAVFAFVSSFLGAGSTFRIFAETQFQLVFILVDLITIIWLISTFLWNLSKGLIISAFVTIASIVSFQFLEYFGSVKLIPEFIISVVGNVVVQLVVCSSTLVVAQFIIAAIEILYSHQSSLVKLVVCLVILFISAHSSLSAFTDALQRSDLNLQEKSLQAGIVSIEMVTVLGGLSLISSLIVLAWSINRRRQVPWYYPDFIRDLALVIGSWHGTSFCNLDLSNVDFSGAQLANADLRAKKLYRTRFQGVIGLERARVDNQYLDLAYPKVQKLLTHGCSPDPDFRRFNLQGSYLQNADMRGFDLTDTNLTGADLEGADLRGSILIRTQLAGADFRGVDLRRNVLIDANLTEASLREADLRECILVRAQVARADFTGADMTGICIEDWSVSSKTRFTDVRCEYVYRRYQDGQPIDRYPIDRNFELGEFASLFAEPEDEVELVFKGDFNIAALSLALYKLQTDTPELNLKLRGVEQRENLWVAKIKSTSSSLNERLIQEHLTSVYQDPLGDRTTVETTIKSSIYRDYEETKRRLAESEHLVKELAGISGSQAEALKELSKRSFGNNFFISGSTITNLAGSGQIEYREAASSIRSLVTNRVDPHATLQQLIGQLNAQNVATTSTTQRELIQQVLLSEANQDPTFRQFLIEQEQQILSSVPSRDIAIAVQAAIAQLNASA